MDRRGKTITTFVVFDAAQRLESMQQGDVLELLTDDFEPFEHDLPAWCGAVGHRLIETEPIADGRRFVIEKGPPAPKHTAAAIVVSSEGLEELLSPLGFALAAALERIEVHLFVQGPAVRVLTRGYRPRLSGWARPFSRFAAAGMAKTGHIPAQDKLRQLHGLGAHIYLCGPSMEHFKVQERDLIIDGIPMIEYLSFMAIMEQVEIHLYS
ncbi:MAG: DsrE family protein [Acidimicrobiia bacterium]|nr:DsrE family protein [Acidimicrobiia bacterium]